MGIKQHYSEPENAYGDFSYNGVKLYNSAGCVTNIGHSGSGFSENIGLTWNSQYQFTAVSTNGVECERNGYDALGTRVWKWDGSQTNYFVYDGANVIAEVDPTGGLRRAYVYSTAVDDILAMTVYTGTTVQTYFYIKDHASTVHALLNESGQIVESYRFDGWGRVLGVYDGNSQPLKESAVGNRFLWHAKQYSWKLNIYYSRARVYDPVTGRFLSKDPIGISGGLNEYIYAADNPVNFSDAFGLQTSGAEVAFGETGGIYPQLTNMNFFYRISVVRTNGPMGPTNVPVVSGTNWAVLYDRRLWNSNSFNSLQLTRTMCADVYERNEVCLRRRPGDISNTIERQAWNYCMQAGSNALGTNYPYDHFFFMIQGH